MFDRLTNWLAWQNGWHQEACWDRAGVLEAAREEPQAEPEPAQVTAIPPMQPLQPVSAEDTDAELDDPQLGQAGGNQQAAQAGWIAELTCMDVKAAPRLVRATGLALRASDPAAGPDPESARLVTSEIGASYAGSHTATMLLRPDASAVIQAGVTASASPRAGSRSPTSRICSS